MQEVFVCLVVRKQIPLFDLIYFFLNMTRCAEKKLRDTVSLMPMCLSIGNLIVTERFL